MAKIRTVGNARIDTATAEIALALGDAQSGLRDQHCYDEAMRLRDEIMSGTPGPEQLAAALSALFAKHGEVWVGWPSPDIATELWALMTGEEDPDDPDVTAPELPYPLGHEGGADVSTDSGWVTPLEQRCVVPGHWRIEGRDVRATYEGRSRKVMSWSVTPLDGDEDVPPCFMHLNDVRDWIRKQEDA